MTRPTSRSGLREVLQRSSKITWTTEQHTVTAGSLTGYCLSPRSAIQLPHPAQVRRVQKKSQNSGTGETGLTLSKRYGYVIVLSVLPDSPGTKAGVQARIFESIGGFTRGSVGQALNLLSGQPGAG
jgi:C-terminal processing protease CtpA/Prc